MRKILLFAVCMLSSLLHAQQPATVTANVLGIAPSIHVRARMHAQLNTNGTPTQSTYEVVLTWTLPTGQCATGDQVQPCNMCVYRSVHSASTYSLVACAPTANATTYSDTSSIVASGGGSWDYQVFTEFTPTGATTPLVSGPSNTANVVVPPLPSPATGVAAAPAGVN